MLSVVKCEVNIHILSDSTSRLKQCVPCGWYLTFGFPPRFRNDKLYPAMFAERTRIRRCRRTGCIRCFYPLNYLCIVIGERFVDGSDACKSEGTCRCDLPHFVVILSAARVLRPGRGLCILQSMFKKWRLTKIFPVYCRHTHIHSYIRKRHTVGSGVLIPRCRPEIKSGWLIDNLIEATRFYSDGIVSITDVFL